MSYQTYITPALICGSFDSNTADKSFLLFSREAGMIYASAKSVREERSRQRFALQDFSIVIVSLIKGKTGWRIGSVQSEGNFFVEATDRAVRGSVVRLCKLLRRFVAGEEPHPNLFDEVMAGMIILCRETMSNRALFEEMLVARVLYQLGYIARTPRLRGVFDSNLTELAQNLGTYVVLADLKSITEKATTASHL